MKVEVARLSRHFGTFRAVDDVSFSFESGQIFGFIGPNGAGKTTTMRILATLDAPTAGDAFIDGLSTTEDASAVRQRIGYMPDALPSYDDTTVWEYLDFFARAYGLRGQARERALDAVIDFCQLGQLRERLTGALSKGMRQRLGLARCLVHDPGLLILDEPSAGLDPRARIEFRELLRVLADRGKAVLISSHILSELDALCDAVAIIERGHVVASGSVGEVREKARVAREANVAEGQAPSEVVLELRLARPVENLAEKLAEDPVLAGVQVDSDSAAVARIAGGPDELAALLARLVNAGLPVAHFATRDSKLEDVFMHLTQGRVQ